MRCGRVAVAAAVLAGCSGGDLTVVADARPAPADARTADAAPPVPDGPPGPDAAPLAACETEVSGAAAVPLADLSTTESAVTLPAAGDGKVHGLAVTVDIRHSYPRDLTLTLVSPAGTAVTLASKLDAYEPPVTFSAPARLDGEPLAGTWTLRVTDGAKGDTGTLEAWSLRASGCGAPACATSTVRIDTPAFATEIYRVVDVDPAFRAAGARVGISLGYEFDEDLAISLASPGGALVALSRHRGDLGSDYTGTVFDDAAAVAIADGFAPFTGSFRPDEPLGAVAGGPAAGVWVIAITGQSMNVDVQDAALEVDLCDLPCPSGSTPHRYPIAGGAFAVADAGSVAAAAVRLDASGGYLGLRAPLGPMITLAPDAPGGYAGALFADWAAPAATDGAAPRTGPRRPADALAGLAGAAAAGTWTLVADGGTVATAATLELCLR